MFTSSKNTDWIKGMGIGIAVGTMAAVAGTKMMTRSGRKSCKKSAAKCMRTVEEVLDSITAMTK